MTARHPLFEFMPYGAPEVLSRQAERMLSAQAVASLSVALVLGLLSLLLPPENMRSVEIAYPPHRPENIKEFLPIAPTLPQTPIAPPRAPVADPSLGRVVPVEEPVEIDLTHPAPPAVGEGVTMGPHPPQDAGEGALPQSDRLPARGEWQYVEEFAAIVVEVKPEYPDIARQAGVEGRVIVHVLVGTDGRVLRVELDEAEQVPMLNQTALEAARRWVFTPGYANKRPVATWVAIPFDFRLR